MKNHMRAIWDRWISVITLGIVATAVWYFFAGLFGYWLEQIAEALGALPLSSLIFAFFTIILGVFWLTGHGRWRGWLGFRRLHQYPALWVSLLVSAVLLLLIDWVDDWPAFSGLIRDLAGVINDLSLWTLSGLAVEAALFLALVVVDTRSSPERNKTLQRGSGGNAMKAGEEPTERRPENPLASLDFQGLVKWVTDQDDPIADENLDGFGHRFVGKRIAKLLEGKHEDKNGIQDWQPSIALIGPFGSGKTSILNMVRTELETGDKTARKISLVDLSLWQVDTPSAAIRKILGALTKELGKHVNILAVTGLPSQYIGAVEAAGGPIGAFLRSLLSGSEEPTKILARLDRIALALNLKIVLWIEDMERFADVRGFSPEARAAREAERLGKLRPLLYALDRCTTISVVFAATSLESGFDIEKVARFVEYTPTLSPEDVWDTLDVFRAGCLDAKRWNDFRDLASDKAREELAPPKNEAEEMFRHFRMKSTEPKITEAIAALLGTPRNMKSVLRICYETWDALAGEIDFDDVLAISVIRVSRPRIFTLVDKYQGELSAGVWDKKSDKDDDKEQYSWVIKEFNQELGVRDEGESSTVVERDPMADEIRAVLRFIFPGFDRPDSPGSNGPHLVEKPQGLAVNMHANYWRRYMRLSLEENEEQDQKIADVIHAWKADETNDLVARVMNPNRAEAIKLFVGLFKPEELLRLLEEAVDVLVNQDAKDWELRAFAPGISMISDLMHLRRPMPAETSATISNIMSRIIGRHLPLAFDILNRLTIQSKYSFIDSDENQRIWNAVHSDMVKHYSPGNASELIKSIKGGWPWLIRSLADPWDLLDRGPGAKMDFSEWDKFAMTMLEAARIDPSIMLPQFAAIVTQLDFRKTSDGEGKSDIGYVANYITERARNHFTELDDWMSLFKEADVPSGLDDQAREAFDKVKQAALDHKANQSSDS